MSETVLVYTPKPMIVVQPVEGNTLVVQSAEANTVLVSQEQGPAGPIGPVGPPGPQGADGNVNIDQLALDGGNF